MPARGLATECIATLMQNLVRGSIGGNANMTRTYLSLACSLSLLPSTQVPAQQKDVPPVVLSGLQVYRAEGAAAAVKAWLVNSPVSGDAGLISNTTAALKRFEAASGPLTGQDILQSSPLGSRALRNYVILLFERGPLYAYFDTYRTSKGWIVTGFLFNSRPDEILPRSVFEGRPK